METLLSWCLGFFSGYLCIRAIRSFGTTAACLALLAFLTLVASHIACQAACTDIILNANAHNDSGTIMYPRGCGVKCNGTTSCFPAPPPYYVNPGGSALVGAYSADGAGMTVQWFSDAGYTTLVRTTTHNATNYPPGTTFDSYSSGATGDHFLNKSFTNNTLSTATFTFTQYQTNGTPVSTNYFTLNPGDIQALNITNSFPFAWSLTKPGDITTDFIQSLETGSSNPSTIAGTGANYPQTSQDPFSNIPQQTSTIPTNSLVADRQNAQGILDAIAVGNQALQTYLPRIAAGTGNTNSGGANDPAITNLLTQIRNNQSATNHTEAEFTSRWQALANSSSNTLASSAYNSNLNSWISSADHSITNEATPDWQGGAGVIPIESGILSRVLDFNPFNGSALMNRISPIASWVKKWFGIVVSFVLFWVIFQDVRDIMTMLRSQSGKVRLGQYTLAGAAAKALLAAPLIAVLTAIIAGLPTLLYALYAGWGQAALPWLPSLADDISAGGPDGGSPGLFTNAVSFFFTAFRQWVPWAVIMAAIVNYGLYSIASEQLIEFTCLTLRAIGIAAGCIALCLLSLECEAVEVNLENLTGSPVAISNSVELLTIPPGLHSLNLASGDWECGPTNIWQIPVTDERVCIRFAGSTDTNAPAVYTSVNLSTSPGNAFINGLYTGWAVFGFAWMVSAVNKGVRLYRDL